jgi:hypothetical protein
MARKKAGNISEISFNDPGSWIGLILLSGLDCALLCGRCQRC